MALSDYATINTITAAYGAADASLQATLATSGSATLAKLTAARDQVHDQMGENDFDYAQIWLAAARTAETGIAAKITILLDTPIKAIDTYFKSQYNLGLKAKFKSDVVAGNLTWDNDFRLLWRRVMTEELTVKLAHVINASGTWTVTAGTRPLTVASEMEFRFVGTTTTAPISITASMLVGAVTQLTTLTIPTGTTSGTVFALSNVSANKFTNYSTLTVVGGSTTDRVELWVK